MSSQPIAFDPSRDLRALKTSSSLKMTASVEEKGFVIGGRGNGLVVKTE